MTLTQRILLIGALSLSAACAAQSSGETTDVAPSQSATSSSSATDTATTAQGPAVPTTADRYCGIVRRLERAGEKAFSDLDRDSTPSEYEAAERSFVLDNAGLLDRLMEATPNRLATDVDTMLTAMRQRAGLVDDGVTQRQATEAERRVLAWERRHC